MVSFTVSTVYRRAALVGMAYFATASATLLLSRFGGGLAIVWLATAILVAELCLTERHKWWPTIVTCGVAMTLASGLFGLGPVRALPLAAANIGEAVLAAHFLHKRCSNANFLDSLEGLLNFALASMGAIAIVSVPAAAIVATKQGMDYLPSLGEWFIVHSLGTASLTPLAMLILSGELNIWWCSAKRATKVEAFGMLALMIIICAVLFGVARQGFLFILALPLMVATFRLERMGAAAGLLVVAIIGGTLTAMGYGPVAFGSHSPLIKALFFQLYLAATVVTVLPVAAELQQRKRIFRRLLQSEAQYKLIADNSTDMVLSLDMDGKITYASPSVQEIMSVSPATLVGKRPHHLAVGPAANIVAEAYRGVVRSASGISVVEYRATKTNGEARWFEASTRGIFGDNGVPTGWVSTIRDISERKSLELQLAHAATTDPLTGLSNRRAFDTLLDLRISGHVDGERGGCIAIFDIDFFKRVNDEHGHGVGDQVLAAFAEAADRVIRSTDHIARLGGEEFGIIFAGADLAQAAAVCERLRLAIADLVTPTANGAAVRVTVSAGVAQIRPRMSRAQIMRAADDALYKAKAGGRDRLAIAA